MPLVNGIAVKDTNDTKIKYRNLFHIQPSVCELFLSLLSIFAGAVALLGISSSVSLAVPFCMGRLIDLVHTAAAQGGMEETLMKVSIGLSVIFVIGAAANMGRVYLLQVSGKCKVYSLERIFSAHSIALRIASIQVLRCQFTDCLYFILLVI